jgi:hypothetical protein
MYCRNYTGIVSCVFWRQVNCTVALFRRVHRPVRRNPKRGFHEQIRAIFLKCS